MQVTDVRIKLISSTAAGNDRLLAFATVTFDGELAVHDVKVVLGMGGVAVAMPDRASFDHCPTCRAKALFTHFYCPTCGDALPPLEEREGVARDPSGRIRKYHDVVHPIVPFLRARITSAVLKAYQEELEAVTRPGRPTTHDVLTMKGRDG